MSQPASTAWGPARVDDHSCLWDVKTGVSNTGKPLALKSRPANPTALKDANPDWREPAELHKSAMASVLFEPFVIYLNQAQQ